MAIDRDGDGPPLRREDARPTSRPADDLRATAFTDDVFDDEYHGRKTRSGGSFSLVAGVIFGAAIAAAAGWYVFGTRDVSMSGGEDGSQIVKADPDPYKVKPEDPGGLQVENQDKTVYDRVAKGAAPSRVENLLPEPEKPKAPPVKKAEAPAPAPAAEAPAQPTAEKEKEDPLAKLVAQVTGAKPDAAAPKAVAATEKPMSPVAPLPTQAPAQAAAPAPIAAAADKPAAPAASAPLQLGPATPPAAAPAPAPIVASAEAPKPAPPQTAAVPAAPAAAAGVYVQLVSTRSEDSAMGEWKRISGKNADVLQGLSPSVVQAEVPDKGIYFRLRAGPVADKAAADQLCSTLSSRNVGCIVVRQ